MAKQEVVYTQGGPLTGDSGERGNSVPGIASIKPQSDGERATAANLARAPENLRKRTEVLRTEMEGQKYLQDSDMRWVITSGQSDGLHTFTPTLPAWPTVTSWLKKVGDLPAKNRWLFTIDPATPLVVQPLNTPSTDKQESITWTFVDPDAADITISMTRRAYSGANIREVIWLSADHALIPGDYCTLSLSGEDDHILTITIRDDDLTQMTHMSALFVANAAALATAGFVCTASSVYPGTFVKLSEIPIAEQDYIFSATQERELHYIPASSFANFFAVNPPGLGYVNCLEDGDTLAIVWLDLTDNISTGRRQAIPGNANTTVLFGQLFKTSDHPEYIPLAIPLCKRVGDELLWVDGTLISATVSGPVRFGENGYTVNRIAAAITTATTVSMGSRWCGPLADPVPTWATVQAALDGIVADLAGTQNLGVVAVSSTLGAYKIGMPTTAQPHVSLGYYNVAAAGERLSRTLDQILGYLNNKASLNLNEAVTGDWSDTGDWTWGEDSIEFRDALVAPDFRVVYRNNGQLGMGPVDDGTVSIYEGTDATLGSGRVTVVNGIMVSATTVASSTGSPISVTVDTDLYHVTARHHAPVIAAPLDVLDAEDWDTWDSELYVGSSATAVDVVLTHLNRNDWTGAPAGHVCTRIYEGNMFATGGYAHVVAVNARWNAMGGTWHSDNSTRHSIVTATITGHATTPPETTGLYTYYRARNALASWSNAIGGNDWTAVSQQNSCVGSVGANVRAYDAVEGCYIDEVPFAMSAEEAAGVPHAFTVRTAVSWHRYLAGATGAVVTVVPDVAHTVKWGAPVTVIHQDEFGCILEGVSDALTSEPAHISGTVQIVLTV